MSTKKDRGARVREAEALRAERARHRANMAKIRERYHNAVVKEKTRHRDRCAKIRST